MVSHHVKTEAIYLENLGPIDQRVDHQAPGHRMGGSQPSTTEAGPRGAIGIHVVVVARSQILEHAQVPRVIIDHIENDPHSPFMDRINQVFELHNPGFGFRWMLRIHTGQREVAVRIVSPVVVVVLR
ncbi:MAG: hypothetical protein BWY82_01423 [Verrucomicrobia bacterium ADurb.Bin474]|nr:MAG: hypothetical protein BWY82_01423 [Verrucomicrobia bacterium ADurb.Bin474]